jgi:hypothetical protein
VDLLYYRGFFISPQEAYKVDYHKIVFRPDVPTDPDKMREWLQQWHKEHNPSQADDQPGYIATDQGRQLLGLAIGGKN